MALSVNGPMKMYKISPLYDYCPDITLPTTMYKMRNVYEDTVTINSNDQDDVKLLALEKHQFNIIQKLENLKDKVLQMKKELGVENEKHLEKFQDIVIKANPEYPPLSIWVFYNLLSKSLPVRLVTYVHSSLASIPGNIQHLPNNANSDHVKVSLTVIWRDGGKDHEMMIDPIHQGIIEGEVNIARYISRLLSFNYEHDPVVSTQIDNWLEIAHSSLIHGNNKDRQGALRSLNSHLGKSNFLVGDSISLADIITWSAIIQTNLFQSLPANVTKWFKSLLSADIFSSCEKLIDMQL